jgi:hypothetical protein
MAREEIFLLEGREISGPGEKSCELQVAMNSSIVEGHWSTFLIAFLEFPTFPSGAHL